MPEMLGSAGGVAMARYVLKEWADLAVFKGDLEFVNYVTFKSGTAFEFVEV